MGKEYIYNNIKIDMEKLSSDSQSWLIWYHSLTEEMQQCVNYHPSDFADQLKIVPYYVLDAGKREAYNPGHWNTHPNILRANCYAYAMDVICYMLRIKLQPGEYALNPERNNNTIANNAFINMMVDIAQGGFGTVTNAIAVPSVVGPLQENQVYIALVVAPLRDYHWYIQHKDGSWSHKRGLTEAIDYDASGRPINGSNLPDACNRKYIDSRGNILDYSVFISYYIVTH